MISDGEIDLVEILGSSIKPDAGAVVAFVGVVRADPGVMGLEVEAYEEAALEELRRIKEEAIARFGVSSVDVVHRTGRLSLGEVIVVVVCGSSHRREAFQACEYVIDELKRRVPIWKKEQTEEGERWVRGDAC
ncbi:MAG TPA: molybdenum cofactor biosynthesis protein MoaE [Methanothrix sp.]|nr:molybdenum cofactor biosynthesis protein MoaE [Methanothrix sp.]HOK58833.1 molybdenum cofactor biosynthesis protein MoaE [Methanothrix sp.]HOL42785.1 molybdenum cofactor biosynthesis protein MoaE [Methanothrix sp.]HPO89044.1 molybdenum cofactor biosynthesis protein MoaE [Methanothrix sp.]